MKRILIQAFCFGIIALGGTHLGAQEALAPSTEIGGGGETNYQTCMRFCMADNCGFDYCHGQCKGLA
jgi:hypothetical protein